MSVEVESGDRTPPVPITSIGGAEPRTGRTTGTSIPTRLVRTSPTEDLTGPLLSPPAGVGSNGAATRTRVS